jgi:hypothetical protein
MRTERERERLSSPLHRRHRSAAAAAATSTTSTTSTTTTTPSTPNIPCDVKERRELELVFGF